MMKNPKLGIEFSNLGDVKRFKDVLTADMPVDSMLELLKAFYTFKMGQYVNTQDYESLKTLEGVLELHNLVKGTIEK